MGGRAKRARFAVSHETSGASGGWRGSRAYPSAPLGTRPILGSVERHGGTAAIIPPTAEKQAEPWLSSVWETAETVLASSEKWIVVGYSLPPYDHAVRDLLRRSAARGHVRSVVLHDPFAAELAPQWRDVTSLPVEVEAGL